MTTTPFSVPSEPVVRDADPTQPNEPPEDSIFLMTTVIVGFGVGISALVVLTTLGWAALVAIVLLIPIGVVAILLTLNHMMREPEEIGARALERPVPDVRPAQPASARTPAVEDPLVERPGASIQRLLIVSDVAAASPRDLPDPARTVIEDAANVRVVAPVLPGRLDWLCNDDGQAKHAADERLRAVLANVRALGAHAGGRIGADTVLVAVADAVAEFDPDHILIALSGNGHARWQEHGLLSHIEEHYGLPMTTYTLDAEGHMLGSPDAEPALAVR